MTGMIQCDVRRLEDLATYDWKANPPLEEVRRELEGWWERNKGEVLHQTSLAIVILLSDAVSLIAEKSTYDHIDCYEEREQELELRYQLFKYNAIKITDLAFTLFNSIAYANRVQGDDTTFRDQMQDLSNTLSVYDKIYNELLDIIDPILKGLQGRDKKLSGLSQEDLDAFGDIV